MTFFITNINYIVMLLTAVLVYFLMNYAKIPMKTLMKLLPFCKNKRVSTALNASAGLSESCVIASLIVSLFNLVSHVQIGQEWALLAGSAANFAYLFIENICKAKGSVLTDDSAKELAVAFDNVVAAAEDRPPVVN